MTEDAMTGAEEFKPPTTDPWKGFRGVCAGTLVLESIVVLLALPVVATVGGGLSWASTTYILVLAALMILGAGVQGRSWALRFDLILQVPVLLGFFAHYSISVVGFFFALVWLYLVYLRRDIRRRIAKGLLEGQRD